MNEDNDQGIIGNNQSVSPPPGLRKLFYKGKNAGKNALKNIAGSIGQGIKNIWIALSTKGKIIVIIVLIFVILCACSVVVLADYSFNVSNTTISNYIGSLPESSDSFSFYNRTSSLLLVKDEEIKEIVQEYLKEVEVSNYNLYALMNKKYGTDSESKSKHVSSKEKKLLYEHFLNTEKYNFNKINWVKYTRSEEDGNPDMKVDKETRLQYPEDSEETSLQTFANMFQPYIQSYIIPYSLYVGLITDGRIKLEQEDENASEFAFGYEILNNTYHDIQVNQYNLKNHTIITQDVVYDKLQVTVTHTVSYNSEGEETSESYSTSEVSTVESCVHETETPQVIDAYDTWNVKYKLKYAKVFDKHINNEYLYTEYDLNNDPDDQTITRSVYKDTNYQNYEAEIYDMTSATYEYSYDANGVLKSKTGTVTINMKKGYTDMVTSTWKDTLEQVSHEEMAYTAEDIEEGLNGDRLSSSEEAYYKEYEYKTHEDDILDRLNTFDIANSKKEVYKKYLRDGENYSENIGYSRSWMSFSFYTLRQAVKEITQSDSGWKYFYGSSIGAEEATSISNDISSLSTELNDVDYSSLPAGKLGWPSPGNTVISSYFGARSGGTHRGIDISMPIGSTFVAAASGKVVAAVTTCTDNYAKASTVSALKPAASYCGGGAGNYVKIKVDDSETYLIYMHMTDVTVSVGDEVVAGQAIGTCGTTGRSTGPHAHFEVRVGGSSGEYAVDPCNLFDEDYCHD